MRLSQCDELDRSIVAFLQADARMPFRTIGSKLNTNEATISWRVRRLQDQGLIELRALAPTKQPSPQHTQAIVTLDFEHSIKSKLVTHLTSMREVKALFDCAGSPQLVALIEPQLGHSVSDIIGMLSKAPGLTGLTSELVLKVIKPLSLKLVQSQGDAE